MARRETSDVVVRAQRGDDDAWAELYAAHGRRLVVWLRHLSHGDVTTEAEDVAAEAWLIAATKIAEFRGGSGDFAGWLFAIARNVARGRGRASVRRNTTPVPPESMAESMAESRAPASQEPDAVTGDHDTVRRLLAQLPEREAQVVACLDVVGLDTASTARALGISSAAVRVARHRGLKRLRRLTRARFGPLLLLR